MIDYNNNMFISTLERGKNLQSELYSKELIDRNTVNLWSNPHHWNYLLSKPIDIFNMNLNSDDLPIPDTFKSIQVEYQKLYLTISITHHHQFDLKQIQEICIKHGFEFGRTFVFLNDTPNDIIHLKNKVMILLDDKK